MKKLPLGVFVLTGAVFASSGALAIDGCPAGTFNTTAAPDGESYSTLFDNFVALAGDIVNCSFEFPVAPSIPKGNIVVYSADYRGGYEVEAGDELDFSVTHNGTTDGATIAGPATDDVALLHSNLVASSNGKVTSSATLDLGDDVGLNTFAALDSADYTELGRITLATDQTAMVTHFGATAGLLTGGTQPTQGGNEVGLIGGYGSSMLGAVGRYNMAEGLSVLGGVSLLDQTAGATQSTGVMGAAAVRYIQPGVDSFQPFAEGGLVLGGFQTTHPNTASAVPTGLGSIYAKGGVTYDVASAARVSVFGTLAESALSTAAFTQTFTGFTVNVPQQTGFFTTAKVTAAATMDITPEIDLTAEASAGTVISHSGITATIPGLGTVSGAQDSSFMEYGLRLGWKPTDMVRLEAFAQGSTGPDIGTHNMVGVGARLQF